MRDGQPAGFWIDLADRAPIAAEGKYDLLDIARRE
jgi:hypothetical protein